MAYGLIWILQIIALFRLERSRCRGLFFLETPTTPPKRNITYWFI